MNFDKFSHLEGTHAFLSPSNYHWINYDMEKLEARYMGRRATMLGTRKHELADECIKLGIVLPDEDKTLNLYVNDAIYLGMSSEVMLYYSDNCYGTADAIKFENRLLRIHDLKTGVTPGSMHQLEIYSGLFCIQYDVHPNDIDFELRIYQDDRVVVYNPDPVDIINIIEKIISFDRRIEEIEMEAM